MLIVPTLPSYVLISTSAEANMTFFILGVQPAAVAKKINGIPGLSALLIEEPCS